MLDNQLTMVYYNEALQKAAQSRAEHKAKSGRRNNLPAIIFTLTAVSVAVSLTLMFIAG